MWVPRGLRGRFWATHVSPHRPICPANRDRRTRNLGEIMGHGGGVGNGARKGSLYAIRIADAHPRATIVSPRFSLNSRGALANP